jgi:hypothetical protein
VAFVANLLLMMVPLRDMAEVNGAMLQIVRESRSDRRHDMLYIAKPDDCLCTGVRRARRCPTIQFLFLYARVIFKGTTPAGPAARDEYSDRVSVRRPQLSPRPLV